MSERIAAIKDQIQEALPDLVESMIALVRDKATADSIRAKVFEALCNRGGLPAVTAGVHQRVTTTVTGKELLEAKRQLLSEQKQLDFEIRALTGGEQEIEKAKTRQKKILPQPCFDA